MRGCCKYGYGYGGLRHVGYLAGSILFMQGYGELLHRRLPLKLRLGGSRESYVHRIERGNSDVCAALDIGFAIKKEKVNPTRRKPSVFGR